MVEQINKKPLVSCIIIFLNAVENFFIEAIESIFAQTYDNWELLLADDGSADESTAIALRYAQQYPDKVRYLEHEGHQNRGMSATRNLGIRHAKGEYIALLDADDIWLPQKLEKQVAILEAHPEAGMVYGSTLTWFGWTGNPEDAKHDRQRTLGVKPDTLLKPPTLLKLFLKGKAETPGICGVLIHRKLVEDVGGFEESFRGLFEDKAFFAKVCVKASVFVESGCWDRYRQHPKSSCYVAQALGEYNPLKPNPTHLTFLTWLEKYLCEQGYQDTEIWQALNKALWPYQHPRMFYLWQFFPDVAQSFTRSIKKIVKFILRQTWPKSSDLSRTN
ncbi:glycosyltransferase family 2 protein [Nostoc sp. DSM 114167]|jgi:glycosyltransferase involved in cell wall biosynthesis|uniref:glycosyltransferase family 2 protein n=1 Tax=Nostoc sp. DSM 114167 TaxID=3439050 RepID=UPI0040464703